MENNKTELLHEIQKVQFAVIEAHLFLDTHPDDQQAISYYQQHSNRLQQLLAQWENQQGHIQKDASDQEHWAWVKNPWPWEMEE